MNEIFNWINNRQFPYEFYFNCKDMLIHSNGTWNMYKQRSNAIKEYLEKKGLDCSVCRHTMWDVEMYIIQGNSNNRVFKGDIVRALDLEHGDVELLDYHNDNSSFAIKESTLHDKYLNDDGELVFEEEFDLLKLWDNDSGELGDKLDELFGKNNWIADKESDILLIECDTYAYVILQLLGCNYEHKYVMIVDDLFDGVILNIAKIREDSEVEE